MYKELLQQYSLFTFCLLSTMGGTSAKSNVRKYTLTIMAQPPSSVVSYCYVVDTVRKQNIAKALLWYKNHAVVLKQAVVVTFCTQNLAMLTTSLKCIYCIKHYC